MCLVYLGIPLGDSDFLGLLLGSLDAVNIFHVIFLGGQRCNLACILDQFLGKDTRDPGLTSLLVGQCYLLLAFKGIHDRLLTKGELLILVIAGTLGQTNGRLALTRIHEVFIEASVPALSLRSGRDLLSVGVVPLRLE